MLCCQIRPCLALQQVAAAYRVFFFSNHVRADVWHEISWELCVGPVGRRARCFNLACYAANPGGILKQHIRLLLSFVATLYRENVPE